MMVGAATPGASAPAEASSIVAVSQQAAVNPAQLDAATAKAIKAFPQNVGITYVYRGLPIPARLKWESGNGRYSLTIGAALFGRTRAFSSEGRIGKNGLEPERFTDTRDGKLANQAVFDWSSRLLTLHDGDKTSVDELHQGDQDLFSAAFQFALQGVHSRSFTFSMISGRKVYKNVAFAVIEEQTWRLSGQLVDVVLLRGTFEDRVFDFWLAPQWSNLPVRMVLNMGKDAPLDLWATQIDIDGTAVLQPPTADPGSRPKSSGN